VLRLPNVESFLTGKSPSLETFEEAGRIARNDVAPISDVRGSKDYRLQLAENIMLRFYFEQFGGDASPRSRPARPRIAEARR
jgi:xanthine dehydrogenase small subunit